MKRITVTLLYCLVFLFASGQNHSNNYNLKDQVPMDPNVRIGTLDNGLKYYIRQNKTPKNIAELRLAINAGSILEDDDQRGLAHFIEHMAFNGTINFEKNQLINYLQNLGVRFGADLNAHTSFNETVYKLSLPSNNEEVFNKGFEILKDWADGISFDQNEIESERGVILSEALGRKGVKNRIFDIFAYGVTNGSRYYHRLPIGKEEIIRTADRDRFLRFYKDWYRPDLMAVIVVGDVNIDSTEQLIKRNFNKVKQIKNPREREYFHIPDNDGIKVFSIKDKEATEYNLQIFFKKRASLVSTLGDFKEKLLERLYTGMLNDRFTELFVKGDAPYMSANVSIGTLLATTDSYYLRGALKESSIYEGLNKIFYEHERARRDGFTVPEFERYKTKILSSAYNAMHSQEDVNSKTYVDLYVDNYIDGVPIPGENFTYEFYRELLPKITLEEVNKIADKWIGNDNISIVFSTPEKDGVKLPSDDELKEMLLSSYDLSIKPYIPEIVNESLMKDKPVPGKVLAKAYNIKTDITTLTLSNGTEVILKPSRFRKDIVMNSFRPGGTSLAPDSLYYSVRQASELINNSGLNGFTISQLRKINTGKQVTVKPSINFYDELVSGKSSLQDFETLLQMTHLYFTAPYKNEAVFRVYKDWLINNAKDADVQPERFFYDEISRVMSQNHMRAIPITPDQYKNGFQLDKAFDFYVSRFSNAYGFKFIFIGDFDVDQVIPLIELYIASLPSKKSVDPKSADIGLRYKPGVFRKEYFLQSENKSNVVLHFNGVLKHTLREKIIIDALASVLKLRLYEEVREKMGGVYGVGVSGFTTDNPYEWFRIGVEFVCRPEDVDRIIGVIKEEIEKIKRDGPLDSDVNKVREAMRVSSTSGKTNNDYILSRIKDALKYGLNLEDIMDVETGLGNISKDTLKEAANKYLSGENFAQFVLYPKKEK